MGRAIKYTSWHIFPNWIKLLERIWIKKWRPIWLFECHCWNIFENQIQSVSKQIKSCWCLNTYNRKAEWISLINAASWRMIHNMNKRWIFVGLTREQINDIIQLPCAYCWNKWGNSHTNNSCVWKTIQYNWIDRINSLEWYTAWNTVPCCKYCNFAKNNLSLDDFKKQIILIYNHLNLWARS